MAELAINGGTPVRSEPFAVWPQYTEEEAQAAFRPDVAMTLNNLGNVLSALGDRAGAKAAYEEAISIYTPFAQQYPKAFGPKLVMVQRNLARLEEGWDEETEQ